MASSLQIDVASEAVLTAPRNPPHRGTFEQSFKISEYEKLARDVFKNLNPATDIYFSQGPMDVLDHSCSKLGFGGKMCIDGTFKFEEETDEDFRFLPPNGGTDFRFDLSSIISEKFSEVKHINASLLKKQIPVLIISVEKNRKGHIRELHQQIFELKEIEGVKMILYVEHTVDANDLTVALWRFCNNLDPKRDNILLQRPSTTEPGKTFACIGFDGTRKTKELDDFGRDWPNIIVADEATIKSVDEKWDKLGLGEFIPSPSLKFKDQLYGEEAVVS